MVSPVGSSSKSVYYFAAAALGIYTVLFLRARNNAAAHPAVPSLDNGRLSFLSHIPGVCRIYNYFNSTQAIQAPEVTSTQLPTVTLGSRAERIDSIEKLTEMLEEAKKQHQSVGALIIYGANFVIYKDPGILALNPEKLILVGPDIISRVLNQDETLYTQMLSRGWSANRTALPPGDVVDFSAKTIEQALEAKLETNPVTSKPIPKVFSVYVSYSL